MPTKPKPTTAIRLTMAPRHRKLAERLVKSGRFASASEVVGAAMALLEEEQRDYDESVAGIRRGLADMAAGRMRPAEDVFARLDREIATRRGK